LSDDFTALLPLPRRKNLVLVAVKVTKPSTFNNPIAHSILRGYDDSTSTPRKDHAMKTEEITEFLASHKEEMAQRFGVVKLGLFGSYARGEAGELSDIDIAVELNTVQIADSYFGVLHFLEDHLGKKIDLGVESNLRPEIREQIQREIIYV